MFPIVGIDVGWMSSRSWAELQKERVQEGSLHWRRQLRGKIQTLTVARKTTRPRWPAIGRHGRRTLEPQSWSSSRASSVRIDPVIGGMPATGVCAALKCNRSCSPWYDVLSDFHTRSAICRRNEPFLARSSSHPAQPRDESVWSVGFNLLFTPCNANVSNTHPTASPGMLRVMKDLVQCRSRNWGWRRPSVHH
jgi:hypothetical protein